jgi:predicted DCC family thiol-disulfide oxidoreductase YuxK
MSSPVLVLYDRDCRFCVWGVVVLARRARPGAVRLATIQGDDGDRLLGHLDPAARLASWHAWDGERLRSEADVLDALGPRLRPGPVRAAVLGVRLAPRPLTAFLYRQMAEHRVAISRLVPERAKRRSAAELARWR